MKVKTLPQLKRLADRLAGGICRDKGICEAKGHKIECDGPYQWAHILSRRFHATRWLPQNSLCLCRSHHALFTYNPDEWIMFLINNYEETYIWLYEKKNTFVKINRSFMEKTIKELEV